MGALPDSSTWRLKTAGGIPYKLMEGYPRGTVEDEEGSVTEKYIIESSRLLAFFTECFSDWTEDDEGEWTYRPPRACPGLPMLVTEKVDFEPMDLGKPVNPFGADPSSTLIADTYCDYLMVTITYKPEDVSEITCDGTGEFLLIPVENANFEQLEGSGGTGQENPDPEGDSQPPPTMPIPKVLPGVQWSIKFPRIPLKRIKPLILDCREKMGTVNSEVMPVFDDAPAETILFLGFSFSYKRMWRSDTKYAEFQLKFFEKMVKTNAGERVGHNHFYNPKKGDWEKLEIQKKGETPARYTYEATDLNTLVTDEEKDQQDQNNENEGA